MVGGEPHINFSARTLKNSGPPLFHTQQDIEKNTLQAMVVPLRTAVTSRRGTLSFAEAFTKNMNRGTSEVSHCPVSNVVGHVGSIVPSPEVSSNLVLEYTSSTGDRVPQLCGQASSVSKKENVSHNEVNPLSQQYEQSVLSVHMLDNGLVEGSLSLRITAAQDGRQELLDLEDHIGNVNTGLSNKRIDELLKHRRKYFLFLDENSLRDSCIICQEDYIEEDELGTLNCRHDFHHGCIRQWLRCKNVCPVCKLTGLTISSDPNIPTNT
ncbi:hypothetical protein IFM89_011996 [Coptis chinensis]|uniref:RING-type E3 ubiquitin transferase n=1 Tax=Coptis chinensis TaxID=261450 RepID=A0A835ICH2_9MAGN|nr:hypothetical protein IFM89_011996 [Coptis chinensis]